MIIDANQAREILGVGKTTLRRLIDAGAITPTNKKKDGAKRFYAKFDSVAIRAYKKTITDDKQEERRSKTVGMVTPSVAPSPLPTIPPVLSRIETKIDLLLAAWGITVG